MATVWTVADYGVNYSQGDVREVTHLEKFASMRAAGEALWTRVKGWDASLPNVDRDAQMRVWLEDPQGPDYEWPFLAGSETPDRVISIGPRGGIRVSRA